MNSSPRDSWFDGFVEGLREHERERGLDLPRYEIRDRLGEGGAAVVYRAWDRQLGRLVAVKILRDSQTIDPGHRARFQREVATAAGLTHPNLVSVYDAGEAHGRLFLVMELVEGKSLETVFRDEKVPLAERISLVERTARGVAAAHGRGIVHRDLKPSNVLVTAAAEPKVTDFGLARVMGRETRLTQPGVAVGTPSYMAPEQVSAGREITQRTDVYALGAILYEGLTGRLPHEDDSMVGLFARILEGDPVSPRELNPHIPRDVEAVCLKALDPDPARRYAEAGAFADDLQRVLAGEPAQARAGMLVSGFSRGLRRHRSRLVGLTGGVLMAAAAAGLFFAGASPGPAVLRARLKDALERTFAGEVGRVTARFDGLHPVRLLAALEAAAEPSPNATPTDEIKELLDYELRKLRLEGEFIALNLPDGRPVYASGPAGLLKEFRRAQPKTERAFLGDGEKLWVLVSNPVYDTAAGLEGRFRGTRWIGFPLEPAVLRPVEELGHVVWTDGTARPVAGTVPAADAVVLLSRDALSEEIAGNPVLIRQHLVVSARGFWSGLRILGVLLAAVSLGLLLSAARPRKGGGASVVRVTPPPVPGPEQGRTLTPAP